MASPGVRIPPVTLYADKEHVQNAFRRMTRAWICLKCGKEFSLLESMGALTCKQHPGYVQEDGKWSCCGQRQFQSRWAQNWPVQRMYGTHPQRSSLNPYPDFKMPYKRLPTVRGCQPCDHNTSDAPYTHKDAMSITDLSALLPFLNKEFPFHLREGFDSGALRRCSSKRKIVIPPGAAFVRYMDNSGEQQIWQDGQPVPDGIELAASNRSGKLITVWQ